MHEIQKWIARIQLARKCSNRKASECAADVIAIELGYKRLDVLAWWGGQFN